MHLVPLSTAVLMMLASCQARKYNAAETTLKSGGGISVAQVKIIQALKEAYDPELPLDTGAFEVKVVEDNEELSATARWRGGSAPRIINVYGGLARLLADEPEAFAWVLCHEMGHHFGGPPIRTPPAFSETLQKQRLWAAAEGQADYYSSLKCMRRLLRNETMKGVMISAIPGDARELCTKVWAGALDQESCERSIHGAGVALKKFGKDLGSLPDVKPGSGVIVDRKPDPACRLQTVIAGALCRKRIDETISPTSTFSAGVCSEGNGNVEGIRPLCWFAPTDAQREGFGNLGESYYMPY